MSEKLKPNKEQQILVAAEQEFLIKGYDGARTINIAKRAGVTHAMLHYYFRTKEKLFERIIDEKFTIMSDSLLTMLGDCTIPIIERLKNGIESHFDFVAANPLLPRFLINEIMSRPELCAVMEKRVTKVAGNIFKELQRSIDEAAEKGEIEWVEAPMLMMSIMSLNIFTFIAYPLMERIVGDVMSDREKFLAERKAENVEIIMRRIQKNN